MFTARGGRLAFAALRIERPARVEVERWHVVLDMVRGAAWDGLAQLTFGPHGRHFAYAGERGGRWHVVTDGVAGRGFDALAEDSIALSPGARRVGYVAQRGACALAIVDGRPGPCRAHVVGPAVGGVSGRDVVVSRGRHGRYAQVELDGRVVVRFGGSASLHASSGRQPWAVVSRLPSAGHG